MSDKTIFGCAETGTYQTSAPNPHIELSGTASTAYSIAQLFADAMSTNETATVSVVKDKDNWAVYGGAKFTNSTPDTLDLSVATLLESKGTLSSGNAVTCLGLAPGNRGMDAARVCYTGGYTSPNNTTAKITYDTVSFDTNGIWDATNYRFVPKKPGYYLVTVRAAVVGNSAINQIYPIIYKNGAAERYPAPTVIVTGGCISNSGTALVYCNGSTDNIEIYWFTSASVSGSINPASVYCEVLGPLAA